MTTLNLERSRSIGQVSDRDPILHTVAINDMPATGTSSSYSDESMPLMADG